MCPRNDEEPAQFVPAGFKDDFLAALDRHNWTTIPHPTIDHLVGWMEMKLREAKKGFGTGDIGIVIPD